MMIPKNMIFLLLALLSKTTLVTATPTSDERYRSLETFARAYFLLETLYVEEKKVSPEQLVTNALKGITHHLDPHTVVLSKQAFEQLTMDTKGKFGGIGIILSTDENVLTIISIVDGSPAQKGGLKPKDIITGIEGMRLSDIGIEKAVEAMRGDVGSEVVMTVLRPGNTEELVFKLKREVVQMHSVEKIDLSEFGAADSGLLAIRINSFQESTFADLQAMIQKSRDQLKGIILDLRNNPGGLLDQAVKVSDLFIDEGIIVSTSGRDPSKEETELAKKRGTVTGIPITVITNRGSASASEIVAGALQDHKKALIVGQKSYGKGSVQTVLGLPDGSGLKLTVAKYFTPLHRSIQGSGIVPDITISADNQKESPIIAPQNMQKALGTVVFTKDPDIDVAIATFKNHAKLLNSIKR